MVFVLPIQIAHGVSLEVANSINEQVKTILPEDNVIPPIPFYERPDMHAVVVFVQDSTLPKGHSSTWLDDDAPTGACDRMSEHYDTVYKYARKLCEFAEKMPTQCSRDVRLAVCIPTPLVLTYAEELKQIGNASKYHRSRSVRYDEDSMVVTLLDVRYVLPINSEDGELLEGLFRGTHVLSKFLRVMPSATVEADSPDKCLYAKHPWFLGCEMSVAHTEEEMEELLHDKVVSATNKDGHTFTITFKALEASEISARKWVYIANDEFDGIPSVTDAVTCGKLPDLLKMRSSYATAARIVRSLDLL